MTFVAEGMKTKKRSKRYSQRKKRSFRFQLFLTLVVTFSFLKVNYASIDEEVPSAVFQPHLFESLMLKKNKLSEVAGQTDGVTLANASSSFSIPLLGNNDAIREGFIRQSSQSHRFALEVDDQPALKLRALTQGHTPLITDTYGRIHLPWKRAEFSFAVWPVTFLESGVVTYQYRLEGLESSWYDAGVTPAGRYHNLSGGRYTLKIRAKNTRFSTPDLPQFSHELVVDIDVAYPPWVSGWAILLYCALFGIFIWALQRWVWMYRQLEQAHRHASEDLLTGVANRRAFMEYLDRYLHRSHLFGSGAYLCVMDADHFKSINDRYGHMVGDDVLVHMADKIKNNLRKGDFVARWGGEEFVILLPNTPLEETIEVVERLRTTLASSSLLYAGGINVTATASFGVTALMPNDDPRTVLERADHALYLAKSRGRNRFEVTPLPTIEPGGKTHLSMLQSGYR